MVSGPSWSYSKEFHKDGVVFVFLLEGTQFDWRWTIFTDESLPLDEIFMIFYRFFSVSIQFNYINNDFDLFS